MVRLGSLGVDGSLRNLDLSYFSLSVVRGMSAKSLVFFPPRLDLEEDCSLLADKGEEGSLSVMNTLLRVFGYQIGPI